VTAVRIRVVVGVALVAVLATACGHTATTVTAAPAPTTHTTPTTRAEAGVTTTTVVTPPKGYPPGYPLSTPFVADPGGPPKPPTSKLLIGVSATDVWLGGTLYEADWGTVEHTSPSTPVPWPHGSAKEDQIIGNAHSASVWFITVVPPDAVTVHSYATVSAKTGEPDGPALTTFECSRLQAPKCAYAKQGTSTIRVNGLGRELLDGNYITVFAMWHATAAQVRAGEPPERTATWLYRGDQPGPVQL
jgi:hypothetical protein